MSDYEEMLAQEKVLVFFKVFEIKKGKGEVVLQDYYFVREGQSLEVYLEKVV